MKRRYLALALSLGSLSCTGEVSGTPTYFRDVQPILQANCVHCHGPAPAESKLGVFRLDRYVKDDARSLDVFDYRDAILRHAVTREKPIMPPPDRTMSQLTARQKGILRHWIANGAPKGARKNRPPEARLISPMSTGLVVDQSLEVTFRAFDVDRDGLIVAVGWRPTGTAEGDVVLSGMAGGIQTVAIDTGTIPSLQRVDIFAVLDDGFYDDPARNAVEVTLLRSVSVDHGAKGTAPTVRLLAPNGGQTLIGPVQINWTAADPDTGDTLTFDLELLRIDPSGASIVDRSIAKSLAGAQSFTWDTAPIPDKDGTGKAISYKLRIIATDGKNIRTDDSDQTFSIAHETGATTLIWTDVRPFFVTYCADCHGEPSRSPAHDYFRLDKYDRTDPVSPVTSDDGVYEVRGTVYEKISSGSMPPASRPQPSASAVNDVLSWILGGAPKSSIPVDGPPTFTWTTPNDSAVVKTNAAGQITLVWNARDPENKPLAGGEIAYAKITANNDQQAYCDTSTTGWTALAGVSVTAGTLAWTAPSAGYFCFRGTATDAGGNTATVIAKRAVKR